MLEKLQMLGQKSEQEEGWRQFSLQSDKKQAILGIMLLGIIIIAFFFYDYQLVKAQGLVYGLIALKLVMLVACVIVIYKIGTVESYRSYDKFVTLGLVMVVLGATIINMSRPDNYAVQVVLTGMRVFVVYLIIPNRFLNQFIISTTMTIVQIALVILFLNPTSIPILFTVFLSLVFANLIAFFSAWQLHSYRKKSYEDYVKCKALQEALEQHLKLLEQTVAERTEKLKDAERLAAIGATAGMVGHDLRNPLMAITGAAFLAKKNLKNFPDGEAKKTLQKNLQLIGEQTVYMDKIIADLQNYAGPLHPKFEETSLHKLAESVLVTLNVPRGIKVACLIDNDFPKMKTDSAYMKRILTNLSNNGIQAMPQGGKLTIRATNQQDTVTITVEDTGEGIAEEMKTKLFTPLVTTKAKGQGFGLAVVKRLTEALGGKVTYKSEVGTGTAFNIELPQ